MSALTLEFSPAVGNRLDFDHLIAQCRALLDLLDCTEPGGKWSVAQLSYSSPAKVVIEPQDPEKADGSTFLSVLNSIVGEHRVPVQLDHNGRSKFQKVLGNANRVRTVVSNPYRRVSITEEASFPLEGEYRGKTVSIGRVKGRLQGINTHGKEEIRIYPMAGPAVVECKIPQEMIQQAGAAIDRYVVVTGKKIYRSGEVFPHRIEVSDMQVLETPPTWEDLRGSAPGMTGGKPSEEYVRELRDAGE